MNVQKIFATLNIDLPCISQGEINVYSPIDGSLLASLNETPSGDANTLVANAQEAFLQWRCVPAPKRGQLVYDFAQRLRQHKQVLAQLITLECGKIVAEAEGEVQEMIDICDFAVGLSRQLHGLTIASERPDHALRELWQPLGPTLIISAFNFPMAVWSWNAALALVCGNSIIWKPSELTPLCALACQGLLAQSLRQMSEASEYLSQVAIGGHQLGAQLVDHHDIPLVSATGSCNMGQQVGPRVAQRFGRSLLELGGNNAIIVSNQADLDLALRGIVFGAVGTAGQRCTTTRRLFLHRDIADALITALGKAYQQLSIGDPRQPDTLVGPLINHTSFDHMHAALQQARQAGCKVIGGEKVTVPNCEQGSYVQPAIVDARGTWTNHAHEVFAPILYCFDYAELEDAITRQNAVDQGLSSAIFTRDIAEAELFLSARGSDCGIANVNLGTSGAEIGGAFGGEKHTGGGRESGSDAWKNYMRRMTATVNYSKALPLAQGIDFNF
ncbi:MAG: aldehyde dehydrogenase family protein [Oleiphilaceae bacterium]|nr:aldehyde dehydrogenase family protein [Oleiphilaceae bacterium]